MFVAVFVTFSKMATVSVNGKGERHRVRHRMAVKGAASARTSVVHRCARVCSIPAPSISAA